MSHDALIAERTATWTDDERSALARVVAALHPSARHLVDILDWLDDIAVRETIRPAAVLVDRELDAIVRAGGSAPDRLKRWKERLRRLRYPRLAGRETAAAELVRTLALGPVTVSLPPDLEGGAITFTIRARSAEDLGAALARLEAGMASGGLRRLFALLDAP